jgi:XTP/dITP diphosphohydrolase
MEAVMVTSNLNKFRESEEIARSFGIKLVQKHLDVPETRGTLKEIAVDKARRAFEVVKQPVICDDSGFFVQSLKGFPGEFSHFVFDTIGKEGVLSLMKNHPDKTAEFQCYACFFDGKRMVVSKGVVSGKITDPPRGNAGFGYDPIFVPEGQSKTFAEDFKMKMKLSHRLRAMRGLFSKMIEDLPEHTDSKKN